MTPAERAAWVAWADSQWEAVMNAVAAMEARDAASLDACGDCLDPAAGHPEHEDAA